MYLYPVKIDDIVCLGSHFDSFLLFRSQILYCNLMNIISRTRRQFFRLAAALSCQCGIYHDTGNPLVHPKDFFRVFPGFFFFSEPVFLFPSGFQLFFPFLCPFLPDSRFFPG